MTHGDPASDPSSTAFIALIDVADDVAGAVLAELAREGIAAYAEPLAPRDSGDLIADVEPEAPDTPYQRVHVDRTRIPAARAVISSRLPEAGTGFLAPGPSVGPTLTTEQVDRAWTQLVSDWESTDPPPPGGSGLSSRLIRRHGSPAVPATPDDDHDTPERPPVGVGPRDYSVDDLDHLEEGFVPPEPPPLPRPRHTLDTVGWSGAIGGPVLLVANQVMSWGTWVSGVGVAGFMAGFVILVSRMRNERDHDDPGAVV